MMRNANLRSQNASASDRHRVIDDSGNHHQVENRDLVQVAVGLENRDKVGGIKDPNGAARPDDSSVIGGPVDRGCPGRRGRDGRARHGAPLNIAIRIRIRLPAVSAVLGCQAATGDGMVACATVGCKARRVQTTVPSLVVPLIVVAQAGAVAPVVPAVVHR